MPFQFIFWGEFFTIDAEGDIIAAGSAARHQRHRRDGSLGDGVPFLKKICVDLSLKEVILKIFKIIISLLCFNRTTFV